MDEMLIPLGITDAWIEAVDLKMRHLIGHLTFGLKENQKQILLPLIWVQAHYQTDQVSRLYTKNNNDEALIDLFFS